MSHQINGLYNYDESWYEPSSSELGRKMREVYENQDKFKELASDSYETLKQRFNLKKIGVDILDKAADNG